MIRTYDTTLTLGIAAGLTCLSLMGFARTEVGDPTSGWGGGTYQRGYEERFTQSIPTHEGTTALWAALRWELFRETAQGAVAGTGGWLFTAEEFQEPAAHRDLARELSRAVWHLAADGVELVPVIVPDKARIHRAHLPRGRSAGFETRYDRALATIANLGLPAIDLRPALDFEHSFMRTDTHWSPEGARRVAETLSAAVADTPRPAASVETLSLGSAPFEGDLLAFVATGRFRPMVGPQPEVIETYETKVASDGGLFGDAEVPVALVGTSFSANPAFHFEGFLKQELAADVLNASLVGQGPFVPMDRFLAEFDTLSSKPSLVIWEIPERFLTTRSDQP